MKNRNGVPLEELIPDYERVTRKTPPPLPDVSKYHFYNEPQMSLKAKVFLGACFSIPVILIIIALIGI
jgi:hypothetical protein